MDKSSTQIWIFRFAYGAASKKMKLLLGGGPDLRIIPHGRFDTTPLFTHHPPVTASRAA